MQAARQVWDITGQRFQSLRPLRYASVSGLGCYPAWDKLDLCSYQPVGLVKHSIIHWNAPCWLAITLWRFFNVFHGFSEDPGTPSNHRFQYEVVVWGYHHSRKPPYACMHSKLLVVGGVDLLNSSFQHVLEMSSCLSLLLPSGYD